MNTSPHHVDIHVGKRIRHRRWLAGMTQQQLGELVGVKFQQIQKYETGANRVSASRLWNIADELGVAVSFFFDGLDTSKDHDTTYENLLNDKEALALVRAYRGIPDGARKQLLGLAHVLADQTAN